MAEYLVKNAHKEHKVLSRKTKRIIFFSALIALPLIQFAIFYIFVNFESIIIAFQSYEKLDGVHYSKVWVGFDNFKKALEMVFAQNSMITNSLEVFALQAFISLPLALLFSFYLYKKGPGYKFFKVILFLPQIVSGLVFAILYKTVLNDFYHAATGQTYLLDQPFRPYAKLLVYSFVVWMSFGVNVLLFTNSMKDTNPSLVEACEMDGGSLWTEFIHVAIPSIFPTVISFALVALAGIFINQAFLHSIFGADDPGAGQLSTLGYFIFVQSAKSNNTDVPDGVLTYGQLSALGLMITLIIFPLTMGVRKLLQKVGPNTK